MGRGQGGRGPPAPGNEGRPSLPLSPLTWLISALGSYAPSGTPGTSLNMGVCARRGGGGGGVEREWGGRGAAWRWRRRLARRGAGVWDAGPPRAEGGVCECVRELRLLGVPWGGANRRARGGGKKKEKGTEPTKKKHFPVSLRDEMQE